jgi:hypothetical protein
MDPFLKRLALELVAHSERFEPDSLRFKMGAVEALDLLSGLGSVAHASFDSKRSQIKVRLEAERLARQRMEASAQMQRAAQTLAKPEYRSALQDPSVLQALLKLQQAGAGSQAQRPT